MSLKYGGDVRFKLINSLGEAIAHEEKHYETREYNRSRGIFDYEEVFTEYTATFLPRKHFHEIVQFRSIYEEGAEKLDVLANEIISTGVAEKEVMQSMHATAHTGNLYESYRIANVEVTGFAKLYTKATGKSFFTEMSQYTNEVYATIRG